MNFYKNIKNGKIYVIFEIEKDNKCIKIAQPIDKGELPIFDCKESDFIIHINK